MGKESPSSFCSEAAAHIFQTLLHVRVPLAFFGLPGCASPSSHWLDLYVTKQVSYTSQTIIHSCTYKLLCGSLHCVTDSHL